jgi:hypothetical protein
MLAPGFNRWGQVLLHFGTSPFEDSVKAVSGEPLAAHSMQISSSRRPVTGIPACTHGQGVLSLLYTGISSSTRRSVAIGQGPF